MQTDLREAVANAMEKLGHPSLSWTDHLDAADAAIAHVVERCAEVVESYERKAMPHAKGEIPRAIRALAPQEPSHER